MTGRVDPPGFTMPLTAILPRRRRPTIARALRRRMGRAMAAGLLMAVTLLAAGARAEPVELVSLQRSAQPHVGIAIDYQVKVTLPKAVVDVLQRGVPVVFNVQGTVLRPRWYWRDERVARVTRAWRVAYQPITSNWRVGQGGLTQVFATLDDAVTAISRSSNWLLAEPQRVQDDERYVVQFLWQLDTSQLPPPLQLGLGVAGSQWDIKLEAAFGVIP